jgi:hypothetical protein
MSRTITSEISFNVKLKNLSVEKLADKVAGIKEYNKRMLNRSKVDAKALSVRAGS